MSMTWPAALTPYASASFLSRSSRFSRSSPFCFFPAKRILNPYPSLRIRQMRFCCMKSEGDFSDDLESELLEFMERSRNPKAFPNREELIDAGRADLAVAVARHGGWFAFGWDLDRCQEGGEKSRVTTDSAHASSSGRLDEMEEEQQVEEMGVGGILRRLERQRQLLYKARSVEKQVNANRTLVNGDGGESAGGDAVLIAINDGSNRSLLSDISGQTSYSLRTTDAKENSSAPDTWRIWSNRRAGNLVSKFEAAEIVPNYDNKKVNHEFADPSLDENEVSDSESEFSQQRKTLQSDAEEVHLQHFESDLQSLQLRTNEDTVDKGQESSMKDLLRLSDDLEFKQTEIMNATKTLRSIKAKLAVLEHKLQFNKTSEAQKNVVLKRKRLDAAQNAINLLQTVSVVWPSSASEVLLAGSFDGWTSQRRMRRSKAGIFSLQLRLYPGRYEIKFIVDGVWMTDPLRPTVHNNGFENNLFMVFSSEEPMYT